MAYELGGNVCDGALRHCALCLCVDAAHAKISDLQGNCVWLL